VLRLSNIASECPNHRIITLDDYEVGYKEQKEYDKDLCLMKG